jgi:hypothetical protein
MQKLSSIVVSKTQRRENSDLRDLSQRYRDEAKVQRWPFGIASVLAFLFLWLGMGAQLLPAQQATADVLGSVTDTMGAVIPDAKITLLNVNTGIARTTQSSKTGEYLFSSVQIGTFKLTVEAAGFKTSVTSGLTLAVGDRARIDSKLEVGSNVETVEVESSAAPVLQTDSSTESTLISTTAVSDLPMNGRNITSLVQLSAGVTQGASNALSNGTRSDDYRQTSAFSANGQNDFLNNNMVDGLDNNERAIGTQVIKPSIDAIDQVKVMTNLYPAEYSRTEGGVVNVITKSGSNAFHGSLFEYFRNDIFDAKDYFATTSIPELRQNQFGGSIGGPVIKNKTFFFFDYEGFRQVSANTTYTETVPSLAAEEAVANATAGSDVTITDPLFTTTSNTTGEYTVPVSTLGKNLFAMFPAPNVQGTTTNNYVYSPRKTQNVKTFDGRLDHHISDNDLLFARYSYGSTNTLIPGSLPSASINGKSYANADTTSTIATQGLGVDWVHTFTPTLLLEIKAGYTRFNNISTTINGKDIASTLGFASCTENTGYCINSSYGGADTGLPSVAFSDYATLGDAGGTPLYNVDNNYQYQGTLTWNHNTHSVKAGVSIIRRQLFRLQSKTARGGYTLNGDVLNSSPLADLVEGVASEVSQQTVMASPKYRSWEPGGFVQDDWRVRPWLTLNLGVRYDMFTPYTEVNSQLSNFNSTKGVLVSPSLFGTYHSSHTGDIATSFTNVSPRVGFAASLPNQFVVRGGFGFSYFPNELGTSATMTNFPYAWNFNCGASYTSYCPTAMQYQASGNTANTYAVKMATGVEDPYVDASTVTNLATGTEIDSIANQLKSGRLVQYSLEIQKEFHSNVLSVGYIGNLGRHLPSEPNINQATYATASGTNCSSSNLSGCTFTQGPTPYTASTTADGQDLTGDDIYELQSSATSLYNAMQVTFTRRLTSGLALNFNFTWSHAMDNGSPQGEGGSTAVECVRDGCLVDNGSGSSKTVNGFRHYDYGNSDLDVRRNISVMLNYALPFAKSAHGLVGYTAKGWNVNAAVMYQTGMPFTIVENGSTNYSGISGFNYGPTRPAIRRQAPRTRPIAGSIQMPTRLKPPDCSATCRATRSMVPISIVWMWPCPRTFRSTK